MKKTILKDYPVAFGAALLALIFIGVAYFRTDAASELRSQIPNKEDQANRLANNVIFAQKLNAQLDHIADVNRRIALRMTDSKDVATNQQYFYKLESDTGVKLVDVKPGPASTKKKGAVTLYNPVPFNVTVQGDYAKIMAFLRGIESGTKICRISLLTMSAPAKTGAEVIPTITLSMTVDFIGVQ